MRCYQLYLNYLQIPSIKFQLNMKYLHISLL